MYEVIRKVELEGECWWVRNHEPEEYEGKSSWKMTLKPTQACVMQIIDLQSLGIKNRLKKDADNNYMINFSRPTQRVDSKGVIRQRFEAPKVYDKDGNVFDGFVGNGSKGKVVLELYQHPVKGGNSSHAVRWSELHINELVEYKAQGSSTTAEAY